MSRRIKKPIRRKGRPIHTIWTREALSAARLVPPDQVAGQACWACGARPAKTMFGWIPKVAEIHDAYGRLVLCYPCIESHMRQLTQERGPAPTPRPERRILPTYEEWAASASIEELQEVVEKMKRRAL